VPDFSSGRCRIFGRPGTTESAKEGEGRRKPLTPMRGTYYKAWAMSDWVKG